MAVIKLLTSTVIFCILNALRDHWYPLICWAINYIVIASISWYIGRRVTRYIVCAKLLQTVDPTNKAVLITGCDSGFGKMAALTLNKIGFYVFAGCLDVKGIGARDLQRTASKPSRVMLLQMNVTKDDEISESYDKVIDLIKSDGSDVKQLFAIINNAGIFYASQIEWGRANSIDRYEDHIQVNTYGVIRVTRKFAPLIRESQGRIINLSSILARTNIESACPYAMSKAATSKFTEGLQLELAPFGVKSIDVNPWFYDTPLMNPAAFVNGLVKQYHESAPEVKNAYGVSELKRVIKSILGLFHSSIVIKRPEDVVDALVDAVTSYEPDTVYRVITPGLGVAFWLTNDFLPWDLIIYLRRAVHIIPNLYENDSDKYLESKINHNY